MDMVKKQNFCRFYDPLQADGLQNSKSLTVRKPGDIVVNRFCVGLSDSHQELPVEDFLALESLEDELESILKSSLSAEQHDRLDALYCHIARLLAKSRRDMQIEHAIEQAFDAIDDIMLASFKSLTLQQRSRVEMLEQQIDTLFSFATTIQNEAGRLPLL